MNRSFLRILIPVILGIGGILLGTRCQPPAKGEEGDGNTPVDFSELHARRVVSSDLLQWQQFGPGTSGYLEMLEYHPTDPECVMMSPDMFNTYGTWNNGYTWQTVKDCDGNGGDLLRMRDYAFAGPSPDFGLGLDYHGQLWASEDRGRSWEKAAFNETLCSVVEISPHNENTIFIGGGDFWHVKFNERTYDRPHHADNEADYGMIWRSDDRGETWVLKNEGIPEDADMGKIRFHPARENVVYAATSHGLFKSTDTGDTWKNIGSGLPHNMIRDMDLYYDESTGTFMIAVIDQVIWEPDGSGSITSTGGVFKTLDEGETWEDITSNLYLDVSALSEDIQNSFYITMARWFGIPGREARQRFPVLPDRALQGFNRLLIDPTDPDRMYLGHSARHDYSFYGGDLWKTEDAGQSWIVTARCGTAWEGVDRAYWTSRGNPVEPNMEFAHLRHEIDNYRYPRTGCRALTINDRGELMGVFEQQTFRSRDHGESWQQIDDLETEPGSDVWVGTGCSNMPGRRLFMDPRLEGRHYLLSTEHGLWQIVDPNEPLLDGVPSARQITGQNEEHDTEQLGLYRPYKGTNSIASIALHPDDADKIYMLVHRQNNVGHLRVSEDGGASWQNKSVAVETSGRRINVHQYSFMIHPEDPDTLYFCVPSWIQNDLRRQQGTEKFGVYASYDGGMNWERKNNGIPGDFAVNRLAFDPADPDRIYAAVMESQNKKTAGGLFISEDHAATWEEVSIPAPIRSVNDVKVHPVSGDLFIGCGLPGGDLEAGGVWKSEDRGSTWEKIFEMPLIYGLDLAVYDKERILVNVAKASVPDHWTRNRMSFINHYEDTNDAWNLNPGAYITFDKGERWYKVNRGMGQPDRFLDLKFDLEDPSLIWGACRGSGWYKGTINQEALEAIQ